jgi:hypothetical protein
MRQRGRVSFGDPSGDQGLPSLHPGSPAPKRRLISPPPPDRWYHDRDSEVVIGRKEEQISSNRIINVSVDDYHNSDSEIGDNDVTEKMENFRGFALSDDSDHNEEITNIVPPHSFDITKILNDVAEMEIQGQIETDPSVITTQRPKKADVIREKAEQEAKKQEDLHKVHPPKAPKPKRKGRRRPRVHPPIEAPAGKIIISHRRRPPRRRPQQIPQGYDISAIRFIRGRLKIRNVAERREEEQRRLEQMIQAKEEAAQARLSQMMEVTYQALIDEQIRKRKRAEQAAKKRAEAERSNDNLLYRSIAKTEAAMNRKAMILRKRGQSMAEKNADRWLKKRFAEQRMQQEERRRIALMNERREREANRKAEIEMARLIRQRRRMVMERALDMAVRFV